MILAIVTSLRHLLGWVVSAFRSRKDLILENLALRQRRKDRTNSLAHREMSVGRVGHLAEAPDLRSFPLINLMVDRREGMILTFGDEPLTESLRNEWKKRQFLALRFCRKRPKRLCTQKPPWRI